jgi:hypothetical protein
MRDRDVRQVLMGRLAATHAADEGALLLEELGLCRGSVRADLAVVNGYLKGYEIKSERDTLTRLKDQAAMYSRIFDTVTLVVAEKHLSVAQSMIPLWWGIETAATSDSLAVTLKPVRNEEFNLSVDSYSLIQLLWREELLAIIQELTSSKSFRAKPRKALWQYLATVLPLPDLKAAVRKTLKSRKGWQVVAQHNSDGEKFPPSSTSSSSPSQCVRTRSLQYNYRPS